MTCAKKQYINALYIIGFENSTLSTKYNICFAQQIGMHFIQRIARIAVAVNKGDGCLRMIDKKPYQFATCIACATYNSCLNAFCFQYCKIKLVRKIADCLRFASNRSVS